MAEDRGTAFEFRKSYEGRIFLDRLTNHQLLKKHSAPWNQFHCGNSYASSRRAGNFGQYTSPFWQFTGVRERLCIHSRRQRNLWLFFD